MNDKVIDTGRLPTVKTLDEFFANDESMCQFIPYLQANEDFISVLEQFVTNAKSGDDLRTNMLAFIQERKDFVNTAHENFP